jgi:hypothetical protein
MKRTKLWTKKRAELLGLGEHLLVVEISSTYHHKMVKSKLYTLPTILVRIKKSILQKGKLNPLQI